MKLAGILTFIKKYSKIGSALGFSGSAVAFPFDESIALVTALTSLIPVVVLGVTSIIEVWAEATGRIEKGYDLNKDGE